MPKERRITIRLDEDFCAWLEREAAARGLDVATCARMMLYERRSGIAHSAPPAATIAPAPAPAVRDVIEIASDEFLPDEPEAAPTDDMAEHPASGIDIGALVDELQAQVPPPGPAAARTQVFGIDDEPRFQSVAPLSRGPDGAVPRKSGRAWRDGAYGG